MLPIGSVGIVIPKSRKSSDSGKHGTRLIFSFLLYFNFR
jgi:hypothetical protein